MPRLYWLRLVSSKDRMSSSATCKNLKALAAYLSSFALLRLFWMFLRHSKLELMQSLKSERERDIFAILMRI
jgi:uncharacterized membrane protein